MRSRPGRGGEPNSRRWTRLEDRRIVEIAFCRYDCVCSRRCEVFFDAAIGAWGSIGDDGGGDSSTQLGCSPRWRCPILSMIVSHMGTLSKDSETRSIDTNHIEAASTRYAEPDSCISHTHHNPAHSLISRPRARLQQLRLLPRPQRPQHLPVPSPPPVPPQQVAPPGLSAGRQGCR